MKLIKYAGKLININNINSIEIKKSMIMIYSQDLYSIVINYKTGDSSLIEANNKEDAETKLNEIYDLINNIK